MLEIKGLNKRYGTKTALENICLSFGPGEIVGLFGENGAGKTTLMKCVLGFLRYDGSVRLDGEPISRKNIARLSFATCEHSFFPDVTAKFHAEFFGLPDNKPIKTFSTGQQNQFEVILALCQGADYILMDEPFAGNDVFNREDFYKVLAGILEPNETVILSTHLIEEVSNFVSRTVLIHEGKIIGDASADELEEKGLSLIDYVKQTYNYRADRVARAIEEISGSEQQ